MSIVSATSTTNYTKQPHQNHLCILKLPLCFYYHTTFGIHINQCLLRWNFHSLSDCIWFSHELLSVFLQLLNCHKLSICKWIWLHLAPNMYLFKTIKCSLYELAFYISHNKKIPHYYIPNLKLFDPSITTLTCIFLALVGFSQVSTFPTALVLPHAFKMQAKVNASGK